ncbi:hypothetical protein VB780_05305 [Leptolyngbya sp. CCNP1308]|uniref:hypothetical protein n=1 Tax=Leptolyngbya sp. CCNP1308 TaxID=3110255 RepID=UPI002B213336|nr:hypothetical protein [Leptolyngbya sp. CCNP1308]MEA5447976.1 hypothetical protein [Leptolyngbya sp. CCNP1308]
MLTRHQFSLVVGARVPRSWRHVRFWRSQGAGCFCLWGIPSAAAAPVSARLVSQGAYALGGGACSTFPGHSFITFQCPAATAARLALLFPCPAGSSPVVVSGSGVPGSRVGSRSVVQLCA